MATTAEHPFADAAHERGCGLARLVTKLARALEEKVERILYEENAKAVARMAKREAEERSRRGTPSRARTSPGSSFASTSRGAYFKTEGSSW